MLDNDKQDDQNQKETASVSFLRGGVVSPTAVLTSAGVIDIETVALRSYLPETLIKKLNQKSEGDILEARRKEREDRKRETESAMDLSEIMFMQVEIDKHHITLTIGGKTVGMTQGELREKMQKRLEELEDRRERFLKEGTDVDEILAIDMLIDDYKKGVTKLANGKIDQDDIKGIEELIEDDPEFVRRIGSDLNTSVSTETNHEVVSIATSFSAEYFDDRSISKPPFSLKDTFKESGNPSVNEITPQEGPATDANRKLDSLFDSYGI